MSSPTQRPQQSISQGSETNTKVTELNKAPQAVAIEKVETVVADKLKAKGLEIPQEHIASFNEVIHQFARSLSLKCQSLLVSHSAVIFVGDSAEEINRSIKSKLVPMVDNIAENFATHFLIPVMERQNLADGRNVYQVLFTQLTAEYYLHQVDNLQITDQGVVNQTNIASNPLDHIDGLKEIRDFMSGSPDKRIKAVAQIARKSSFQPQNIRRIALNRYMSTVDGHNDVTFVGRGGVALEDMKVMIAMSSMSPEERKQVYMNIIGLTSSGKLNFANGGTEMMEYDLKAMKLGMMMGDFTPISFRSFVYQNVESKRQQACIEMIDDFMLSPSKRPRGITGSTAHDMYNLDRQDQTDYVMNRTFAQSHVSDGKIGRTLGYGALHLNALVTVGVNISELAVISKQVAKGQTFNQQEVQDFLNRLGAKGFLAKLSSGALGKLTNAVNAVSAISQPLVFILLGTFASQVATRKLANPSRKVTEIVDEVTEYFTSNAFLEGLSSQSHKLVEINMLKRSFSSTIMKASYLSSKGFSVLHRQSVLNSLKRLAQSPSGSTTFAGFLESLSVEDKNDFIAYVVPAFEGVSDPSAFWSKFVMEYALLTDLCVTQDKLLLLYDHNLPQTGANAALNTRILVDNTNVTSAGTQKIPDYAYQKSQSLENRSTYRLALRNLKVPFSNSRRSLESFEVERESLINREKEFILSDALRTKLTSYGITATKDSRTKGGIFSYSPALKQGLDPQVFIVAENLQPRSNVWGTIKSIEEKSDHLVIKSHNFVDLKIPFRKFPVIPTHPFQMMDGKPIPNILSFINKSDSGDLNFSYNKASDLQDIFGKFGYTQRNNLPLSGQSLIVGLNRRLSANKAGTKRLTTQEYQLIFQLINQGNATYNPKTQKLTVSTAHPNFNLNFRANPDLSQARRVEDVVP